MLSQIKAHVIAPVIYANTNTELNPHGVVFVVFGAWRYPRYSSTGRHSGLGIGAVQQPNIKAPLKEDNKTAEGRVPMPLHRRLLVLLCTVCSVWSGTRSSESCDAASDGPDDCVTRVLLYDDTLIDEMFDAPFTDHCRDTCEFYVRSLEQSTRHFSRMEQPERFVLDTGLTLTVRVIAGSLGVSFAPSDPTRVEAVVPGGQMDRLGTHAGDRFAELDGLRISPDMKPRAFMNMLLATKRPFNVTLALATPRQVQPPDAIIFPAPSWNFSSFPERKPDGQVWIHLCLEPAADFQCFAEMGAGGRPDADGDSAANMTPDMRSSVDKFDLFASHVMTASLPAGKKVHRVTRRSGEIYRAVWAWTRRCCSVQRAVRAGDAPAAACERLQGHPAAIVLLFQLQVAVVRCSQLGPALRSRALLPRAVACFDNLHRKIIAMTAGRNGTRG